MRMGFQITAAASYVPTKVVSNQDLESMMDTSDEWIKSRTGITQRYISENGRTSELCINVAQQLLKQHGLKAHDIDLIIVATMSPDSLTPSTASIVQGAIGAERAGAFDLNAACSGFVYGMSVANGMLKSGMAKRIMLIGGEVLSKLVDWSDRGTAVLFGDGAGGVIIQDSEYSNMLNSKLESIGEQGQYLTAGVMNKPVQVSDFNFEMNGRRVYEFATKQVPYSIEETVSEAGLELKDIDHFLLHQANARIIKQVAKKLNEPIEKFPCNIDRFGNTAAASEPLLLAEQLANNKIKRGDVILLSGFGGGLTIATTIIKF